MANIVVKFYFHHKYNYCFELFVVGVYKLNCSKNKNVVSKILFYFIITAHLLCI